MNRFVSLLRLDFLPRSVDLALLALRLWFGLSMLFLHGWGKLTGFEAMAAKFPDPFGIGPSASLALAVFGEVVCAALVALGLFTRFASLCLIVNMSVAFFIAHKGVLQGSGSGELAYLYLAGYVALFLAGGGRFAVDALLAGKSPPPK